MIKRYVYKILLVITLSALIGCGGTNSSGPYDGTVTFQPASMTFTIAAATLGQSRFVVVVKDANGIPLKDVQLTISFPFAMPHPTNLIRFLEGPSTKEVNSPVTVVTDTNGTYTLWFTYTGGADYKGDFVATAGSIAGTASFEMKTE